MPPTHEARFLENQMNLKFRKKPVVIEAFQMTEERFAKVFSAVLGAVWTNILQ